jgi:hypothetical protein
LPRPTYVSMAQSTPRSSPTKGSNQWPVLGLEPSLVGSETVPYVPSRARGGAAYSRCKHCKPGPEEDDRSKYWGRNLVIWRDAVEEAKAAWPEMSPPEPPEPPVTQYDPYDSDASACSCYDEMLWDDEGENIEDFGSHRCVKHRRRVSRSRWAGWNI